MDGTNSISLLSDITKIVNSNHSIDQVFSDVASRCAVLMKLDKIVIYSYNISKESLVQRAISSHNNIDFENEQLKEAKMEKNEIELASTFDIKMHPELSVPIMWKGKLYGFIDSRLSSQSFDNESNKLLFTIIASLLTPKFIEFQKPKRAFKENNRYFGQLIEFLEKDKLYRDENLSLSDMSKRLNVSTSYLSQIINKLGKKSFSSLINEYRVRDVIEAFESGEHRKYSILAIAFDAGFSSKSTFNAVFKSIKGCTPTEFIRKQV